MADLEQAHADDLAEHAAALPPALLPQLLPAGLQLFCRDPVRAHTLQCGDLHEVSPLACLPVPRVGAAGAGVAAHDRDHLAELRVEVRLQNGGEPPEVQLRRDQVVRAARDALRQVASRDHAAHVLAHRQALGERHRLPVLRVTH